MNFVAARTKWKSWNQLKEIEKNGSKENLKKFLTKQNEYDIINELSLTQITQTTDKFFDN